MALPREKSEASLDQKDVDDLRIKELKEGEKGFFYDSIMLNRTQDIYNMLLKSHIHPDAEIIFEYQPLWAACVMCKTDIAEFLIMNGACVEGRPPPTHFIPLLGAISTGKECTELLVRHRANVNARECNGYTALMFAADTSMSATKLLLEHQADVHATKDGKTALDFVKERKAADPVVISLLEAATKMSLRK